MPSASQPVFQPIELYRYSMFGKFALRGGRTFRSDGEGGITATDSEGKVLWQRPSPPMLRVRRGTQRRITVLDGTVWADERGEVVISIREESPHLRVEAMSGVSGKELWSRRLALPRPAWFVERSIPRQLPTEELQGFLLLDSSALILAVQRSTRTITISSDEFRFVPTPEFECQLDIERWDPRTSRQLWKASIPDLYFDIVEQKHCRGLGARLGAFGMIDPQSGRWRDLLRVNADCLSTPRQIGSSVVCASSSGKEMTVWVVDVKSGELKSKSTIATGKRARQLSLMTAGNRAIVNINAQLYVSLSCDFQVQRMFRAIGWGWELSLDPDGAMILYTNYRTVRICPVCGRAREIGLRRIPHGKACP